MSAILGALLLGWLAIAIGIVGVVFIRRLRATGLPEPTGPAASYLGIMEGPVPRLPPPEWVDWDEAKSADEDSAR